jgi:hypothetical protein
MRRKTILQRTLSFLDIPIVETEVWEALEDEQRRVVIGVLARLIAQAMMTDRQQEKGHER